MKKIILILSILILNSSIWAAVVDRQITYSLNKYDSISVIRYEDAVAIDSTWYLPNGTGHDSTNFDSTLSIDNTKYTIIDTKIRYHGDNTWKSYLWVYDVAASAAISTADKEEIAQLILDSAAIYPAIFYGPGAGSGDKSIRIYAIDTSGIPHDSLFNVRISIQTITGVAEAGPLTTNTSGYETFSLSNGDYLVLAAKGGYYFPLDTITITANDTIAILGRNYVVASPSAADVSRAYAWVRDASGNIVSGAVLYAAPDGLTIQDTCNGTTIVRKEMQSLASDSDSGYVYLDLTKSKCYNRQNKYTFYIKYGNEVIYQPKKLTVPDSATWALPTQ